MILKKYVSLFENISSKINDVAFATIERVKVTSNKPNCYCYE